MLIGPWAVQDGLGIGLVRSFLRLAVWDRFFGPLDLLSGCLEEPLAQFWTVVGSFWATPRGQNSIFFFLLFLPLLCSLPTALQHFATRAGGLRTAQLE